MVSHDVDHRLMIGDRLQGPFDALQAHADVAGEHGHVGIDFGQLESAEFQVKVAEDVEFHSLNNVMFFLDR